MPDLAQLYDEDFVRWTEIQAKALRDAARAGANLPLDWENLADEVEDLGKSRRSEMNNRIMTIIEHLLKLECSPASDPRRGWVRTVARERLHVEDVLKENPSLRREAADAVEAGMRRAAKLVALDFHLYDEAAPAVLAKLASASYTEEQVLGDWFPAEAGATAA